MTQNTNTKAAQPTPGPWEISGTPEKVLIGNDRAVVARVKIEYPRANQGSRAENEANARLIAAAPTMKEALLEVEDRARGALEELYATYGGGEKLPEWWDDVQGALVRMEFEAVTALAKAVGREG